MLEGVLPVLATPLEADGTPSLADFDRLIDFNLQAGVDGLVFPGNASEVGSLSVEERRLLTERLAARVSGRVPVVIGLSAGDPGVSLALAQHAGEMRPTATMIAPPAILRDDPKTMRQLLTSLATITDRPVILQNAPPPLGPGLTVEEVFELVRDVPALEYVKEECLPAGQRMSRLLASAPSSLRGVFGGAAGRFIMDELARGAIGTMPSAEIPELHVRLFRSYRQGDTEAARHVYNGMVPLLLFTSVFKSAGVKAVLRLRGIIESERHRDLGPTLDSWDHREVTAILEGMADLLGPNAVSPVAQAEHGDVG